MMLAGLLLTLGTGAAFANDGDVFVPQVANATVVTQPGASVLPQVQAPTLRQGVFATSNRPTTSVYSLFARPGYPQGGEN
ncbi:MAG: hypothetical protein J0H99_13800 [Rhodospirillales bacterium]|nr:hypothetical protein [Rhodospirillales bacterium]